MRNLLIVKKTVASANAEQSQSIENANTSRVGLLVMILLLLLLALTYFLPKDPLIASKLTALLYPMPKRKITDTKSLTKNDPALNFALAQTNVGASLQTAIKPAKAGYLLVFVGDCASCITSNLREWERQAKSARIQMVLVTTASPSQAKQFQEKLGLTSPLFFDNSRALEKQLNAVWIGRCYYFDSEWRLRWFEDELHINFDPFRDARLAERSLSVAQPNFGIKK